MVTQEYIDAYRAKFTCAISCLATKYTDALAIGNSCADKIACDMITANNLLKILCLTKGNETDECLTDDEICSIINTIKLIIKLNNCDCNC